MVIPVGPERGSQTLDLIEKAGKTAVNSASYPYLDKKRRSFDLSYTGVTVNSCAVKTPPYFDRVVAKKYFSIFFRGVLIKKNQ
jgi:hypothetical protein